MVLIRGDPASGSSPHHDQRSPSPAHSTLIEDTVRRRGSSTINTAIRAIEADTDHRDPIGSAERITSTASEEEITLSEEEEEEEEVIVSRTTRVPAAGEPTTTAASVPPFVAVDIGSSRLRSRSRSIEAGRILRPADTAQSLVSRLEQYRLRFHSSSSTSLEQQQQHRDDDVEISIHTTDTSSVGIDDVERTATISAEVKRQVPVYTAKPPPKTFSSASSNSNNTTNNNKKKKTQPQHRQPTPSVQPDSAPQRHRTRRGVVIDTQPPSPPPPSGEQHDAGESPPPPVEHLDSMSRLYQRPRVAGVFKDETSTFTEIKRITSKTMRYLNPMSEAKNVMRKPVLLGTIEGVYIPCVAAVLGTILFMKLPWVLGNAGLFLTLLMIFISFACSMLTWLSMSAIVTNGFLPAGGPYYMISRVLGPQCGGSIGITYFFGYVFTLSMHTFASGDAFHVMLPKFHMTGSHHWDVIIFGLMLMVVIVLLVLIGIKHVKLAELVFLVCVAVALIFFMIGVFHSGITHGNLDVVRNNLKPNFSDHAAFFSVLAVIFPSIIGTMAGINRSGDLENPSHSIPRGTLAAILTTYSIYTIVVISLAFVVPREELLHGHFLLVKVAWPDKAAYWIVHIGIFLAVLGEALQALFVAARILQAMAADRVIPFIRPFSTLSGGEPRRAVVLAAILASPPVLVGELKTLATFISMILLLAYSSINIACAVSAFFRDANWRPRFKFFHWTTALAGFIACALSMFLIAWYWALAAFVITGTLYKIIEHYGLSNKSEMGDGLRSIKLQAAMQSILSIEERRTRNWRPQLMCLFRIGGDDKTPAAYPQQLLHFCEQLKKGRGLCIVAGVIDGKYSESFHQAAKVKQMLATEMKDLKLRGFAQVIVAPSYGIGKSFLIQNAGLGALRPNTVVIGWPYPWKQDIKRADQFIRTLEDCVLAEKAVVVCKGLMNFPATEKQTGFIDLWWIVHDGGLELILAFILSQHKVWRGCKLRIFTFAESLEECEKLEAELQELLDHLRIKATAKVVQMPEEDIIAYTYDRDEVPGSDMQKLMHDLNMTEEDAENRERETIVSNASVAGSVHRSSSLADINNKGDESDESRQNEEDDCIFEEGIIDDENGGDDDDDDAGLQSPPYENQPIPGDDGASAATTSSRPTTTTAIPLPELTVEPPTPQPEAAVDSDDDLDQKLSPDTEQEEEAQQEAEEEEEAEAERIQQRDDDSKVNQKSTQDLSAPGSPPPLLLPAPALRKKSISFNIADNDDDRHYHIRFHNQSRRSSTISTSSSRRRRTSLSEEEEEEERVVEEEEEDHDDHRLRWHHLQRRASVATTATIASTAASSPSSSVAHPMSPQAHHHRTPTMQDLMKTAMRLNETMKAYSSESALILINLPSPVEDITSADYMQCLEALTDSFKRVVMVRGCGFEVITAYT